MSLSKVPQEPGFHHSDETLIAVIHANGFTRGCITQAIAAEFGADHVIGLPSINDIGRATQYGLSLIILVSGHLPLTDARLLAEIEALNRATAGVPIVLLSDDCSTTAAQAAACGVRGIISSTDTLDIGLAALRLIAAGGTYCARAAECSFNGQTLPIRALHQRRLGESPAIAPEGPAMEPASPRSAPLTEREAQVLGWLQQGLPNKAIANQMRLSENTVKVHIRRIMRKLKARNRTEVVLLSNSP